MLQYHVHRNIEVFFKRNTKRWYIKNISIADTTTNENYPFIHENAT